MRIASLLFLLCLFLFNDVAGQVKNEDDLKKQAEKFFDNEEYNMAYKLYAQLVSNYPKDPEFNYRLGVCMLYTEPDKKKPFSYLKIATNNPKDAPKDAKFYLAKTYHINYQFDEAIKLYTEYKEIGSSSSIKKLQVDREIEACRNGKKLLSNISDLVVITKKQLNEADYFRSYDIRDIGGKLLVKPEEFRTSTDKKKKENSIIYLPKISDKIFYSSYGEKGETGKDIYMVTKLAGANFSKPIALPISVNTEYDEDYPFLHPNGKTLYFSSKGHNSMGGYDVFKTTFIEASQSWTKPVNLEFPINSPDDDILFVTDSIEHTAYFSTGRNSPYGKIDVLKINTERKPINYCYIKGTVVKEYVTQSLESKITVTNLADGKLVGTFQAGANGDYKLEMPNGGKFLFTVETPGITTQTQTVNVPVASSLKPYKQVVSYDKKILKIINYFDANVEDNYELIRDLIEKKAKLEVSDDATIASASNTATKSDPTAVNTTNPSVSNSSANNETTNVNATASNLSNEQLLAIAKEDAKEATEEAIKLKKEAEDAFGLATQKTSEAQAMQKEIEALTNSANTLPDGVTKQETIVKANKLKDESKKATDISLTATELAKKLEIDATLQKQEADLTNQYIKEIETVIKNKSNKEALAKLEQLQKQLTEIGKQKNQSDELLSNLKAEGTLKENELAKLEKKKETSQNTVVSINNEVKELEKDLTNETDTELKESIKAQIRELNIELEQKNKELLTQTEKVTNLKNEVDGINKEIELTSNILNGKGADMATAINSNVNTEGNLATNTASNSNSSSGAYSLNYESIAANYKKDVDKTPVTKDDYQNQNDALAMYNSDIADLLSLNRNEINNTTDAKEKKKLGDEIKKLEKQKATNDKLISGNTAKLKELSTKEQIANNANATSNNNQLANSTQTNQTSNNVNANNTTTANTQLANSSQTNQAVTNTNNSNANSSNQLNANNDGNNVTNATTENNSGNNTISVSSASNTSSNQQANTLVTNQATATAQQNQQIEAIKNNLNNTSSLNANALFDYSNYKDPTSLALKQSSLKKYNTAIENETLLKTQLTSLEKNTTQGESKSASELFKNAEALNDEALTLRQQLAQKTGKEKEALQQQITEKEKLALELKFKASVESEKENKEQFEINNLNLLELKKISSIKPTADISQASMLMDEAAINFSQAQNMRQEANAYPYGAARLGGLSNADDKEAEGLLKQQNAIELLKKENPNYQLKTAQKITNTAEAIADINKKLEENNALKVEAFTDLSKVNQTEINFQSEKLTNNVSFNKPENKLSQDLKAQADVLKTEANNIVTNQLKTTTSNTDKQKLLLVANSKEIEALKLIAEANQKLVTTSNQVANNTNTNNQTGNNTTAVSSSTTSINGNNQVANNGNAGSQNGNSTETNKTGNNTTGVSSSTTSINGNNQLANNSNAGSQNGNSTATNKTGNNTTGVSSSTTSINGNNQLANNSNAGSQNENSTATNKTGNNTTAVSSSTTSANGNNQIANNSNVVSQNENSIATNKTGNDSQLVSNINSINSNQLTTEESNKLKISINNGAEIPLTSFNTYNNPEAIALKTKAVNTLTEALKEDNRIVATVNTFSNEPSATNEAPTNTIVANSQQNISQLITDAEKLNDEAFKLRQSSASKTGAEKETLLVAAEKLETQSVNEKIEATKKQEALNILNYSKNQQNLEALEALSKGKNIPDSYNIQMQLTEAEIFMKQSANLRAEANAYPNNASKLGGLNNAEEKEALAIQKQEAALALYKKYFPNFEDKNASNAVTNKQPTQQLAKVNNAITKNDEKHIEGLMLLSEANTKEYNARRQTLKPSLKANEQTLKTNAEVSFKQSQVLLNQSQQETDIVKKKKLLVEANKNGQEAINYLAKINSPNNQLASNGNNTQIAVTNNQTNNQTTGNNTQITGNNNQNRNTNNQLENNQATGNNNQTNTQTTGNNTQNRNTNNQLANNQTTGNNTLSNNQNRNNASENNNVQVLKVKEQNLVVKNEDAYSDKKPIPIDEKLPNGLFFKVQVGAFKQTLPNSIFKGLTPVSGEKTNSGYIRYMAGKFEDYEDANAVKNDLRKLGYADAFVVAYFDGDRIPLLDVENKAKEVGKPIVISNATNTSAGITTAANIPKVNNPVNTSNEEPITVIGELENINGLLFTVQVGIFSKKANKSQLFNLKPIYTEKLPSGLYRYTAGIYNVANKIVIDKRRVNDIGIKDAFITSYYNGSRITFTEGKKIQLDNANIKMEKENPIVFDASISSATPSITAITSLPNNNQTTVTTNSVSVPSNNNQAVTVEPFNNGVTKAPTPTLENGVKADEIGVSFKVQVGAYRYQVPNDVANKLMAIKTWPVNNLSINGLFIYNIGNFTSASFAKKLRDDAVSLGITDAFVTVYKDGKKLYGAEASQYLNK